MKKTFKSVYGELTVTKKLFSKELRWEAVWEDNDRNIEVWAGVIPAPSKSLLDIIKHNRDFYNIWYLLNPYVNKNSIRTL